MQGWLKIRASTGKNRRPAIQSLQLHMNVHHDAIHPTQVQIKNECASASGFLGLELKDELYQAMLNRSQVLIDEHNNEET